MKKKKGGSTLPRKKKGFRSAFKSYWQLYVLVLPAVLYFFVFNYSYVFDIICKYYLVISFCLYLSYTLTAFLSMNRNGQNMDKMIQYQ